MYCSNCGEEIADNIKYCSKCGKEVKRIDINKISKNDTYQSIINFINSNRKLVIVVGIVIFVLIISILIRSAILKRKENLRKEQIHQEILDRLNYQGTEYR